MVTGDDELDDALNVSVLTVGELRRGVLKLGIGQKKSMLQNFVDEMIVEYGDRIWPIDLSIIEAWAQLAEAYRKAGVVVGISDELIAATALVHDFTLVTRNVRHFEHSGCRVVSPWGGV